MVQKIRRLPGEMEYGICGFACAVADRLCKLGYMHKDGSQLASQRPGPDPVFTERLVVNVRPDQLQTLNRLSSALSISRSDLVRHVLDFGITVYDETQKEMTRRIYG